MKFLCVSCNTQMRLVKNAKGPVPDEGGSLSLRYECPECLIEIAMLTNPFETQLVTSMGVEIGGKTVSEEGGILLDEEGKAQILEKGDEIPPEGGKCPFSQMAREAMMKGEGDDAEGVTGKAITWTAQAMARLQNIPAFARPMAKVGIEKYALEKGYAQVNEACLDEAKEHFGM